MIPRPHLRFPALETWVSSSVVARQGEAKKTRYLCRLLSLAFFLERPHEHPLLHAPSPSDSGALSSSLFASTFSARDLRNNLGGAHADYQKYLRPFFDFIEQNQGYNKQRGLTKGYLLRPATLTELRECWAGDGTVEVVDENTNKTFTVADLPQNGICQTSYSKLQIRSLVTFPQEHIDKIITEEEAAQIDEYGSGLHISQRRRRVKALRHLYRVRQWVRCLGGVPNLYADYKADPTDSNGRLYGIGDVHLQRLPRAARKLLYRGTGWWDFDFEACHWSILHSLAKGYGLDTPVLDDYLGERKALNEQIAEDLEVPVAKMKRVMNSTLYDQPLSKSPHTSLYSTIGPDAIDRLVEQDYYLWLRDELKSVIRPVILANHLRGDFVVNAVGKELSMTAAGKNTPARKLLSHILTGYEAWALNVVCDKQHDLIALMHDGWVTENPRDKQQLQQLVSNQATNQFRLPITLSIKVQQHP